MIFEDYITDFLEMAIAEPLLVSSLSSLSGWEVKSTDMEKVDDTAKGHVLISDAIRYYGEDSNAAFRAKEWQSVFIIRSRVSKSPSVNEKLEHRAARRRAVEAAGALKILFRKAFDGTAGSLALTLVQKATITAMTDALCDLTMEENAPNTFVNVWGHTYAEVQIPVEAYGAN